MDWLGSTTGLVAMAAVCVACLVATLFAMAMAATAFGSERGKWVAAFLLAKLCTALTGVAALTALVLNVIRFAKHA